MLEIVSHLLVENSLTDRHLSDEIFDWLDVWSTKILITQSFCYSIFFYFNFFKIPIHVLQSQLVVLHYTYGTKHLDKK
jgi:hypothetical protein